MTKLAFDKIKAGLEDAIGFAEGDEERGRLTAGSEAIVVQLLIDSLDALDAFRSEQSPEPTRPGVVRTLLRDALTAAGYLELPPDKEDAN